MLRGTDARGLAVRWSSLTRLCADVHFDPRIDIVFARSSFRRIRPSAARQAFDRALGEPNRIAMMGLVVCRNLHRSTLSLSPVICERYASLSTVCPFVCSSALRFHNERTIELIPRI